MAEPQSPTTRPSTDMGLGNLNMTTLIHVLAELIVAAGMFYWFNSQLTHKQAQLDALAQKLQAYEKVMEEQGKMLANHENMLRRLFGGPMVNPQLQGNPSQQQSMPQQQAPMQQQNTPPQQPPNASRGQVPSKGAALKGKTQRPPVQPPSEPRVTELDPTEYDSIDDQLQEELSELRSSKCDNDECPVGSDADSVEDTTTAVSLHQSTQKKAKTNGQ